MRLRAFVFLVGVGLIVAGLALVSPAFALIASGLGVCVVAFYSERASTRGKRS